MNKELARKLIEQLLTLHVKNKSFKTSGEYLASQRGYLTGFLVDLIMDDFYALGKLEQRIKDLEGKR